MKVCPKCVLAMGLGIVASIVLALFVKNAHLWTLLAVVASLGVCMLLGEQIPKDGRHRQLRS